MCVWMETDEEPHYLGIWQESQTRPAPHIPPIIAFFVGRIDIVFFVVAVWEFSEFYFLEFAMPLIFSSYQALRKYNLYIYFLKIDFK